MGNCSNQNTSTVKGITNLIDTGDKSKKFEYSATGPVAKLCNEQMASGGWGVGGEKELKGGSRGLL